MGIRCAPAIKLEAELLVTPATESGEEEREMEMRRRSMKWMSALGCIRAPESSVISGKT